MAKRDDDAAVQLHFRVREDLRARLDAEAKRRGATLSAEIARRLEDSFQLDAKLRELEIEREHLRDTEKQRAALIPGFLERERLLTDHLLKLTAALALQGEQK